MNVLVVEDNAIDAQALIDSLAGLGLERGQIVHIDRLAELVEHRHASIDVVLLDLSLPDGTGLESIRAVQAELARVPIVVLTADDDSDNSLRMLRGGAQDYLVKGHFDQDALLRSMRYAVERAGAEELRQRLYHADRLAVVGQLAAGVAHEIANPATLVKGNLVSAQRKLLALSYEGAALATEPDADPMRIATLVAAIDDVRRSLDQSLSGLERITRVAQGMQSYARVERSPFQPLQLNEVVQSTCRLADVVVKHKAQLLTELSEVPEVLGDRTALEQIVTNLVVNAAHAIEDGDARAQRIVISTELNEEGVVLAVEDSGPGVPVGLRQRIFEPFFTTKPRGLGTGLGLSIALELARTHGGALRCVDGRRGGARFELVLPAARSSPVPALRGSAEAAHELPDRARVLLVDDEPGIRSVYRELLAVEHDVAVAASGRDALELLTREASFDVILCDMRMPDMSGRQLHEHLQASAPALLPRIVFCTGGLVTESDRAFVQAVANRVLRKPVAMELMVKTIAEVVAENRGRA